MDKMIAANLPRRRGDFSGRATRSPPLTHRSYRFICDSRDRRQGTDVEEPSERGFQQVSPPAHCYPHGPHVPSDDSSETIGELCFDPESSVQSPVFGDTLEKKVEIIPYFAQESCIARILPPTRASDTSSTAQTLTPTRRRETYSNKFKPLLDERKIYLSSAVLIGRKASYVHKRPQTTESNLMALRRRRKKRGERNRQRHPESFCYSRKTIRPRDGNETRSPSILKCFPVPQIAIHDVAPASLVVTKDGPYGEVQTYHVNDTQKIVENQLQLVSTVEKKSLIQRPMHSASIRRISASFVEAHTMTEPEETDEFDGTCLNLCNCLPRRPISTRS